MFHKTIKPIWSHWWAFMNVEYFLLVLVDISSCLAHLRFSTWPKSTIIPADLQIHYKNTLIHKVQIHFSHSDQESLCCEMKKLKAVGNWKVKRSSGSKTGLIPLVFDLERPGSDYPSASVHQSDGTQSWTPLV